VDNIRVYAGKGSLEHFIPVNGNLTYIIDVPNPQELLLRTKVDSIRRFITIVQPLKRVYKLPDASLHIFYNLAGPVIAFNAGGALFLNLRYFEGWRKCLNQAMWIRLTALSDDAQVKQKEPTKAIISWFFTLAHEIAVCHLLSIGRNHVLIIFLAQSRWTA